MGPNARRRTRRETNGSAKRSESKRGLIADEPRSMPCDGPPRTGHFVTLAMLLNHRPVRYVAYRPDAPWLDHLPARHWACVLIVQEKGRTSLKEVAPKLLLRDVAMVCTAGAASEWAHDLVDDEIVFRQAEGLYLPPHLVLTTWDRSVEEALWFAAFTDGPTAIEQVAVLDMTGGDARNQVAVYLHSLASGSSE